MENQLWNLFRDTGDPVGYLLYHAQKREDKSPRPPENQKKRPAPKPGASL